MTASVDLAALRERVRDALDWPMIAQHCHLKLDKDGPDRWKVLCPFHAERTPSCRLGGGGSFRDRYHCFGCGADGDYFQFWQQQCNVDHAEAVKQLAGLAGVYFGEIRFEKPKAAAVRPPEKRLDDDDAERKPSLPPLYKATEEDCAEIAKGRGLLQEAVWIAARVHRRVAIAKSWPLYESRYSGQWEPKGGWEQHRCWAAIDETRNVAEFRRIDNGLHRRIDGEGNTPKVWSTAGKNWPLGAAQIGDRKRVLLVEGGPDMLAAYHFLQMWHSVKRPLLQDVAVVCMLGAGNKIRESALSAFAGCRVRIMVDADTPKDSPDKAKRKLVGLEAAARWTAQLTEAGAAVECYYVGDQFAPGDVKRWHDGEIAAAEIEVIQPGFMKPDGSKVKDTNDLALCAEDVTRGDDVREAFTSWDF